MIYILLFLTAFLYAGVGHGGASGYLALMALYGVAPEEMKPTALVLNLFVSLVSFSQYYRGNYFRSKLFLPLVMGSMPMAYVGGRMSLDGVLYKQLLGGALLIAVARFFFVRDTKSMVKPPQALWALVIGGAIGFVSGLIGIGGGIILSPVLLLLHWSDQKQTAAVSAAFIFVNSLSGLVGMYTKGLQFSSEMGMYVGVAFVGGLLGAYLGARKMDNRGIKYALASVLLIAALKLVFVV
jgi:uncharacterized membrane protein YfcA